MRLLETLMEALITASKLAGAIIGLVCLIAGTWFGSVKLGYPIGFLIAKILGPPGGSSQKPPAIELQSQAQDALNADTSAEAETETANADVGLVSTQHQQFWPEKLAQVIAGLLGVLLSFGAFMIELLTLDEDMKSGKIAYEWGFETVFECIIKGCVEGVVAMGLLGLFVKVVQRIIA